MQKLVHTNARLYFFNTCKADTIVLLRRTPVLDVSSSRSGLAATSLHPARSCARRRFIGGIRPFFRGPSLSLFALTLPVRIACCSIVCQSTSTELIVTFNSYFPIPATNRSSDLGFGFCVVDFQHSSSQPHFPCINPLSHDFGKCPGFCAVDQIWHFVVLLQFCCIGNSLSSGM